MKHENLKRLNETQLITTLKGLVLEERRVTAKILHYLAEVQSRKLFAEMGYSSLFDFAVRELGYSHDAAHRRISAMRLMIDVPEVEQKIESGKLTLATVAEAAKFFRTEKQADKREVLAKIEGQSKRETEKILFQMASPPTQQRLIGDRQKQVTAELTEVRVVLDAKAKKNLDALMALNSHRNTKGTVTGLIELLLADAIKKAESKTQPPKPESTQPKNSVRPDEEKAENWHASAASRTAKQPANRSRYIPAPIKRAVFARDKGQCTYRGCHARHYLEYDHIQPFALGGMHTIENLRLRCRTHNQLGARECGLQTYRPPRPVIHSRSAASRSAMPQVLRI